MGVLFIFLMKNAWFLSIMADNYFLTAMNTMTDIHNLKDYDFKAIESHQQALWENDKRYYTDNAPTTRPTRYMLSMFPYPSGNLHMGHVRNYAITDVLSRYYRLKGYEVMQPMGWDAFGLPAENAAIANQIAPAQWTNMNIDHMRKQLKALGLSIDWGREFATCSPDYYKWEQWLFLQLYKKGLVYKKLATVNWDPVDQTVLANEQVIEGRGWRSGALVEKRDIPMYYFKITDYADELLDDLEKLEGKWPKQVIAMQKNWIGRSHGLELHFPYTLDNKDKTLTVFTTRPDTIMGVTYVSIAPEHPLALHLAKDNKALHDFIQDCKKGSVAESELAKTEKLGMDTGFFVKHPLTGENVQVWVANYVLMNYGSGAVMAVPAHDERDFEFANKYNLPIKQVIDNDKIDNFDSKNWADSYAERGVCINSGELDGLDFEQSFDKIDQLLNPKGLATRTINYRLRDWGVSRQRYWGCPIPMVNCELCGSVPVDEADLPILLPTDVVPDGRGNPLKNRPDFLHTTCPKCGQDATRETDTFDTFVESSWYAQRFACPHENNAMFDKASADKWLPINQYVGGIEHAILHLLYARFFHKVMRDEGLVSGDEPFSKLLAQGMVLAGTFYRNNLDGSTTYYFSHEVSTSGDTPTLIADGLPVLVGKPEKMSKSKNNGVDPADIINEYGADTARLYTLFTAPADQTLEWSDSALKGPYNFIKKVWKITHEHLAYQTDTLNIAHMDKTNLSQSAKALRKKTHETIAKIDISLGEHLALNTPVSALMELTNEMLAFSADNDNDRLAYHESLVALLTMLAIFAPHIGEYLLGKLGVDIQKIGYPKLDESALIADSITMVVQVNGKNRGEMSVAPNSDAKWLKEEAKKIDSVAKFLTGTIVKEIVVPNKLVNIVVKN